MRIVTLAALFLLPFLASAQMERTIYQSFNVDSIPEIRLDFFGDYEVVAWAGNTILTETQIQLFNGTPEILLFFIENGRYEVLSSSTPAAIDLKHKEVDRKLIKTKNGECTEVLAFRVFIPDTFEFPDGERKVFKKKVELAGGIK